MNPQIGKRRQRIHIDVATHKIRRNRDNEFVLHEKNSSCPESSILQSVQYEN